MTLLSMESNDASAAIGGDRGDSPPRHNEEDHAEYAHDESSEVEIPGVRHVISATKLV